MSREIEKLSILACDWRSGHLNAAPNQLWQLCSGEQEGSIACTYLENGVSLRLSPMERGRWKDANFHSKLQIPTSALHHHQGGLVLVFQAQARESIAIALSPDADFVKGNMYEIQLGAVGNTTTTIQRRGVPPPKGRHVSIPSRVCHDKAWISYWICMWEGKVYVGAGDVPGQECIGVLDDSEYWKTPQEAIQYVGFGNMAKGGGHQKNPLMIQKVLLTNVPPMLVEKLATLPVDDLPIVVVNNGDDNNNSELEVKRLMEEYKQECRVRKARAEKFGTGYKEPAPNAFLPWSQAKRLRENPEKGFITGLDLMDPAEVAKQEARKARFGAMATTDDNDGDDTNEKTTPDADADAKIDTSSTPKGLPVIQTWDKEEMLRPQRNDPPESHWKQPPADAAPHVIDEFAMEQPKPVTLVSEKVHLFAIDWAAFKQIRNKDIMSYFSIYGPSYVEWLADLSCNVCFEDKFTASRALHNLSQEIPSPPPADDIQNETEINYTPPDFGNMGWRFCLDPIRKVANDRFGRTNTTARILMRPALSTDILDERPNMWPAPPGGFSSTRVLGPDSDLARGKKKKKKKREHNQNQKDAAGIGHGKKPVVNTFDPASGEDHPLLSQGLSAGRGGFSLEELEKERAQKRAKKTADSTDTAKAD